MFTTTTLFEASRTWIVGPWYRGAILTAVCVLNSNNTNITHFNYHPHSGLKIIPYYKVIKRTTIFQKSFNKVNATYHHFPWIMTSTNYLIPSSSKLFNWFNFSFCLISIATNSIKFHLDSITFVNYNNKKIKLLLKQHHKQNDYRPYQSSTIEFKKLSKHIAQQWKQQSARRVHLVAYRLKTHMAQTSRNTTLLSDPVYRATT